MEKEQITGFIPKKSGVYVGAYKLTHVPTGKFYVGSCSNFYNRRKDHLFQLRHGKHYSAELQKLYNEDPKIHFEFFYTGHDTERARELAFDYEQQMLDDNKGDKNMLNSSLKARWVELPPEKEAVRVQALREAMQTDEYKAKISEASKAYHSSEGIKEKYSATATSQWKDPEIRAKHMAYRRSDENRKRNVQLNIDLGLSKKVKAAGVIYNSVSEASRALGITRLKVRVRIRSSSFPDYEYV